MLVVKTTSPATSPSPAKLHPLKTDPSSRTSVARLPPWLGPWPPPRPRPPPRPPAPARAAPSPEARPVLDDQRRPATALVRTLARPVGQPSSTRVLQTLLP